MSSTPLVDDPAGLTASWLSRALQDAGVDATAVHVAVSPIGTGQLASCHRLEVTYGQGAGPPRLVAKLPSPDPEVRTSVALAYRAEVGFYRDIASRLPVSVPRCYFAADADDGASFTLLLQDMAPATPGDQLAGCTADEARAAAVAVAGLHGGTWDDPSLDELDWLIPPMSELAGHLGPMLVDAVEVFAAKRDLAPSALGVFQQFAERFAPWASGRPTPRTLVHNDYRLDNLLFASADTGLPAVTAVDWQALTTGHPLRDVGFLLGTGLDPVERRAEERGIVGAYWDRLRSLGVTDYGVDECFDDYRFGLFQGPLICLLGEAFAAPSERGRQMFTVMAERAATAILDLDALDLLPDR